MNCQICGDGMNAEFDDRYNMIWKCDYCQNWQFVSDVELREIWDIPEQVQP